MTYVAKCAHCRSNVRKASLAKWTIRLCADGRKPRVFQLCEPCDVALNRHMLIAMGDKQVNAKMAKYRG